MQSIISPNFVYKIQNTTYILKSISKQSSDIQDQLKEEYIDI